MTSRSLPEVTRIPENAVIPHAKLTEYLLAYRRKSDKSQFLAQAGFTQDNPTVLAQAIRRLIAGHDAIVDHRNEYGTFYQVAGELKGPEGGLAVVTVWIHQEFEGAFRFVTLKPKR